MGKSVRIVLLKIGIIFGFVSLVFLVPVVSAQPSHSGSEGTGDPVSFTTPATWADSVLGSLTLEEKIGQIIMVPVRSDQQPDQTLYLEKLIKDHKVGGLVFYQGGPVRQAVLTNRCQAVSKTPLMVAMHAEHGLATPLDSTLAFPHPIALGAIRNDSLIYEMGKNIGWQLRRLGVHIHLAPVADENTTADHPATHRRAFGEGFSAGAKKWQVCMRGLQDAGIVTNARLLHHEADPGGLAFSDVPNIREISVSGPPGEPDVKAVLAGNDVLLVAKEVPLAIRKIKKAVERGAVSLAEIDQRCRRILWAKSRMGLPHRNPVKTANLHNDLHHNSSVAIQHQLAANALTLVKNKHHLLPLKNLDTLNIALVSFAEKGSGYPAFQASLDRYAPIRTFTAGLRPSPEEIGMLKKELEPFNLVLVSIHAENHIPSRDFSVSQAVVGWMDSIQALKKVVLHWFAHPDAFRQLKGAGKPDAVVMAYQDDAAINDLSGQLIFGAIPARGRLPVDISDDFKTGDGIQQEGSVRFQYTVPECLGIKTEDLAEIRTIVEEGMREKAFPGCQILAAKDGKVFYHKSFGYHTYENQRPVNRNDIYDLASVTKIASTTACIMHLENRGLIRTDSTLGHYVPDWVDSTAFENIDLRQMMAHQAGLVPWIPFYLNTLQEGQLRNDLYSSVPNKVFDTRVAENLYIRSTYKDSIMQRIIGSTLGKKEYRYSDLGYYFLQEIVRRRSGMPVDVLAERVFYRPLGLHRIGFNPREWTSIQNIVPTECDTVFRQQLIHGDVHDPGAAMMGGVGGHAGLFSNANDLGVMLQMFLEKGRYGGKQWIADSTIDHFTTAHFLHDQNRRGLGFDKPARDGGPGPTCDSISLNSFGHSGFTGTIGWADPDQGIVYVFLSNRTYPDATNRKLITMNIRTQIQQVIYQAVGKTEKASG